LGKINVAVLMGGKSSEREVSLSTGRMILGALDPEKYQAFMVDTARFGTEVLINPRPDIVLIALHGKYGEDGTVQGLLDLMEIPYVGSGVLASALAMDKIMTRKIMECEGIPVPKGVAVRHLFDMDSLAKQVEREIGYPAVVKPNRQGSTIGLSIAKSAAELPAAVELAFEHDTDVLIEEFVEGTEITVAVLGNDELEALPVVEIVPASGFYDYYSKYTPGATEEIVPARIPERQYKLAQELGLACHKALGCRGMSRTDIIIRGEEVIVLEINTIPGMTPTSLLPTAAKAAGIEFPQLLDRLIALALEGTQNGKAA
jgi:D-alanine-D-alanine ligase